MGVESKDCFASSKQTQLGSACIGLQRSERQSVVALSAEPEELAQMRPSIAVVGSGENRKVHDAADS